MAVTSPAGSPRVYDAFYLGGSWVSPASPEVLEVSSPATEEVVGFSKKLWDAGGAVTWDVPVDLTGKIAQPFLDQLRALRTAAGK